MPDAISGGTHAPAGGTTELRPGDVVIERPGAVHFGENQHDAPITIFAAIFRTAGQPAAIPVNDQGTPVSWQGGWATGSDRARSVHGSF